jgi:hypothetical protein
LDTRIIGIERKERKLSDTEISKMDGNSTAKTLDKSALRNVEGGDSIHEQSLQAVRLSFFSPFSIPLVFPFIDESALPLSLRAQNNHLAPVS